MNVSASYVNGSGDFTWLDVLHVKCKFLLRKIATSHCPKCDCEITPADMRFLRISRKKQISHFAARAILVRCKCFQVIQKVSEVFVFNSRAGKNSGEDGERSTGLFFIEKYWFYLTIRLFRTHIWINFFAMALICTKRWFSLRYENTALVKVKRIGKRSTRRSRNDALQKQYWI